MDRLKSMQTARSAPEQMYESAVELGTEKAQSPVLRTFVLAVQAGMQVGIGAAMAVATLAGLPSMSTANPALAKLVYGVVGLPCGLLMTATTVRFARCHINDIDVAALPDPRLSLVNRRT